MSMLMILMMALVLATGLGLVAAGIWYQLNRERLQAEQSGYPVTGLSFIFGCNFPGPVSPAVNVMTRGDGYHS